MRAVAEARRCSACRTSGRRRSRAAPSPAGSSPASRGGCSQSATAVGKSRGAFPVNVANWYSAAWRSASSGGMAARSCSSCPRARALSMSPTLLHAAACQQGERPLPVVAPMCARYEGASRSNTPAHRPSPYRQRHALGPGRRLPGRRPYRPRRLDGPSQLSQ